jgi:DNA-binding MarR family transcriptional regulator
MVEGLNDTDLVKLIADHYSVFKVLYPDKELKLTEIEDITDVSISTISRLVTRVEKNHIFHIRSEARDRGRPAKYVKLTDEVRRIIASYVEAIKPAEPKYDASTINLLIRTLKDENLPENIKGSAAHRLKDCCSWEGEIGGGKDELRRFFIEALDGLEPNKREEYISITIALEYYIAFQLKDEEEKDEEDILWMKTLCFPKLISKFKEGVNIEERRRVLKILSRIYEVKGLYKKQIELKELLRKKFLDTDEDEGIARDCWDIIWRQADGEEREPLIDELFKMSKSEDEKLKERGQKRLENMIGEVSGHDSKNSRVDPVF